MKKIKILFLSAPTVADLIPLGGSESDPTFNPMIWQIDPAAIEVADDLIVYLNINQTPEQGGVANRGGYNYLIIRDDGYGNCVTYATSLKDHPYRTESDGVTPLKINADVIDLETCLDAYNNGLYHTV